MARKKKRKATRKKKVSRKKKPARKKAKKAAKKRKPARRKKASRKKKPARRKKASRKKKPARKKKAKKASKKKPAKKKKAKKKKRKANPAFMRSFKTTPALQAVVGSSSISRPQATKKIWEYIRKHGLQDARNRRQINVGGTDLGKLFPGKRSVSMFELPKGVSRHLKG